MKRSIFRKCLFLFVAALSAVSVKAEVVSVEDEPTEYDKHPYDIEIGGIAYVIIDKGSSDASLEISPFVTRRYYDFFDCVRSDYVGDIVVPDSVYLREYDRKLPVKGVGKNAFDYQDKLKSVTLPNTVEYVDSFGLRSCNEVYLPKSINKILFNGISGLIIKVTCNVLDPSLIELDSKAMSLYLNCTLYVPDESVELYKNAPQWCEFNQILPISQSRLAEPDEAEAKSQMSIAGSVLIVRAMEPTRLFVCDDLGRQIISASVNGSADYRLDAGVYIVTLGSGAPVKIRI